MILITDLNRIETKFTNSIITLGNFDGIHLGHQELIRMVIRRAKETGGISLVVTFRPHPLKILAPEKCPPLISIYEEKIKLIEGLGADVLVKIPFTREFAALSPADFVGQILSGLLGAKEIFVGDNYRFGRGREGDVKTLKALGLEHGFKVREVEQVAAGGEVISSTAIRRLLAEGEVGHASRLLGRTYAIAGIVVSGDGRGRGLGFPTANIASKHAIVPSNGVYAVRLMVRERLLDGIANIGIRPTFDLQKRAIEVHIFDFNEDIYGEEIWLYFLRKIRDERKFPSVESLVSQIRDDVLKARSILAESPNGHLFSPLS